MIYDDCFFTVHIHVQCVRWSVRFFYRKMKILMNPLIIVYMIYIYIVHKMVLNIYMNDEIMKSDEFLGKRIKEERMKAGYSQEELAEILSVTRSAVSKWETGKSKPDILFLLRIAELFNVDITSLIYGKEEIKEGEELFSTNLMIFIAGMLVAYMTKPLGVIIAFMTIVYAIFWNLVGKYSHCT